MHKLIALAFAVAAVAGCANSRGYDSTADMWCERLNEPNVAVCVDR